MRTAEGRTVALKHEGGRLLLQRIVAERLAVLVGRRQQQVEEGRPAVVDVDLAVGTGQTLAALLDHIKHKPCVDA